MNLTVASQRHHGNATARAQVAAAASLGVHTSTANATHFVHMRGGVSGGGGGGRPTYRTRGPPLSQFSDVGGAQSKPFPSPTFKTHVTSTSGTAGFSNSSTSSSGGSGLPPMALHFVVVGVLFIVVVILGLINAYLHYRSQRRRLAHRRAYVATPEERFASQRRRRSRRGRSTAAEEEANQRRTTGMSVRMKPTKMFT